MMVYRYLSEEFALQLLQTLQWKVGRLHELNDPADCQPTLIGAPSQSNSEAEAAFGARYLRGLYENVGVICFSAAIRDPVVWSHYADSHRGMALGFDFEPSGAQIRKIRYREKRATLNFREAEELRHEGEPSDAFIENVITSGFTCKAPSWRYEQEFRIFVPLVQPHCQMIGSHYFQRCGVPNQVVLGVRCRTTESDILRLGKAHGLTSAQITRARMDLVNHSLQVSFPSSGRSRVAN